MVKIKTCPWNVNSLKKRGGGRGGGGGGGGDVCL